MRGTESDFVTGTDGDGLQKLGALRADVVTLVREKRYEEALSILYRARAESPEDRGLVRAIDRLKEFLIGAYAKRLGGLDRPAGPIPIGAPRTADVALLGRYIDGVSTYADLAQMCPLGQLRTLQLLVGLYTGKEPPRIQGAGSNGDGPSSGLRVLDDDVSRDDRDSTVPETARSVAPPAPVSLEIRNVESEEERRYRESFTRGTASFVQGRYAEAADAFDACLALRPGDRAAEVMLRRSLAQGEGQR